MNFKSLATLTILALTVSSCQKFVEPKSAEIDGDLAGCFELTGKKYELISEDGSNQFTVNVRRTDQTMPFTSNTVGILSDNDNGDSYTLAGFGYTLFDETGNEIEQKEPAKAQLDKAQIKNLLDLKNGEESQLTITVDKELKPAKVQLSTGMKFQKTGKITFEGSIGKYAVKNMEVEFDFIKKEISGKYQYASSPAGAFLWWKGMLEEKELKQGNYVWDVSISETNDNGGWCGSFNGKLQLIRDSKTGQYYFLLPGEFANLKFDYYPTNLKSPELTTLYKATDK